MGEELYGFSKNGLSTNLLGMLNKTPTTDNNFYTPKGNYGNLEGTQSLDYSSSSLVDKPTESGLFSGKAGFQNGLGLANTLLQGFGAIDMYKTNKLNREALRDNIHEARAERANRAKMRSSFSNGLNKGS